jgi:nitric oxide reductase subunit B
MAMDKRSLPIARGWFQAAVLTYLIGFSVLGVLAHLVYRDQPPIPARVVTPAGASVFSRDEVLGGMNVFERYGLMELGSIYGHGAYLGPDFTADYLHRSAVLMVDRYRRAPAVGASAEDRVKAELHANTFAPETDTVLWSDARAEAHEQLVDHYHALFDSLSPQSGVQAHLIVAADDIRRLTAFFAWTAWTSTANRPGHAYSYTNDWPPEPLAGNHVTAASVTWSAVSIIGLLGGMGLVLYFFGRYDWLGWSDPRAHVRLRPVGDVALAPGQRVVAWLLLVSSLLFLVQTLLGGVIAHYRAEPNGFYGWDLSRWLPYNVARTWHLQLAIFWVAASYLATGVFLAPFIAGREPRGQAPLAVALTAALAVVVVGSLAGEYASVAGRLAHGDRWFWLGHQGWEYLDLGRLWQILLVVGLALWVFILGRGLRGALRENRHGSLPWLLLYAALAIPAFYAVGLLASPRRGFVVTDFWRFWVVHLWVEDFLELFTTVVVAYMFVLMGVVREKTALRVIYLDIILYSMGGVIGTMHHLYFSGAPAAHLALGATFSAMEVIPLLLLTFEAWGFLRAGDQSFAGGMHVHRWAVWFLVAVGVWNFLGAGVFGFLINLPVISYYEIGTNLTANHAHTAMMGVYGMLAAGLLLFCLRYRMRSGAWSDRLAATSFVSLNAGLAWMAFANLFPVGIVQLHDALAIGYWHARSHELHDRWWVRALEWLRLPGDALFIVGGAVPLVVLSLRALRYPSPRRAEAEEALATRLSEGDELR